MIGSNQIAREVELPGRAHVFLAVSPDNRLIALMGSRDLGAQRWISVFEIASGKEHARITGFTSQPMQFAFSPDSQRLASSQNDTTVLIWNLQRFRLPNPAVSD